jgi:PhoPQ-activated pathogenicity-related protein
VYGALSEAIDEYQRAGIAEKLATPAGRRLVKLEDPYNYRKRLTLPKLVILGTNDRYWTLDALNLYWDGLRGPKSILYVPNSGHGLEDRERVDATLAAFTRTIARGGRWPEMRWSYHGEKNGLRLSMRSDPPPAEARVFRAQAKTRDFRDSTWSFEPMERKGEELTALVPAPEDGYAAVFGEAVFDLDGRPFTLSTQIRVVPSGE